MKPQRLESESIDPKHRLIVKINTVIPEEDNNKCSGHSSDDISVKRYRKNSKNSKRKGKKSQSIPYSKFSNKVNSSIKISSSNGGSNDNDSPLYNKDE